MVKYISWPLFWGFVLWVKLLVISVFFLIVMGIPFFLFRGTCAFYVYVMKPLYQRCFV